MAPCTWRREWRLYVNTYGSERRLGSNQGWRGLVPPPLRLSNEKNHAKVLSFDTFLEGLLPSVVGDA
jgi:hypothetical protein